MPDLHNGYIDVPAGKIASIVTSLEMRRKPANIANEPPPSPVQLEKALHPDPAWYRDLYRRIGEDWLWFSRLQLNDQELSQIIGDPKVDIFSLQSQGRDEGLLELDFRKSGECELSFFGLTKNYIGKGIGRWMMRQAVDLAWQKPIKRFWVHTCTLDAPGTLQFYVKSGFTPIRRQIEIADDPRVTGKIPRSAAAQIPFL